MPAYSANTKGVFVTRRRIANGSIEVIFKPSELQSGYLLEGRYQITSSNAWEINDARGYFNINTDGSWTNCYGGTLTMTDMGTGDTVSSYVPDKVYKLSITGVVDKFVNHIGIKSTLDEQFKGEIYSVNITGCQCGYGNGSTANQGKNVDLHFQFHQLGNTTKPANFIETKHEVPEQVLVGQVATKGWTQEGNSWVRDSASGWGNRLFLMEPEEDQDKQRTYERILRVRCTTEIPEGKYISLFWNYPDGVHGRKELRNGYNEVFLHIENANKDVDSERPKFDSNNAGGVKIHDLEVTEFHGAVFYNNNWVASIV